MCESDERNQRALHELRIMTGTWTIDLGRLRDILTGDGCAETTGDD